MSDRHALLIGVPTYDESEFNRDQRLASAVHADVAAMRYVLDQSGFLIKECGLESQATGNRIKRAIKEACAAAPAGGVLLVYFSGHGVSAEGDDYLVPADAYLTNGLADTDSLIEAIPRESLRKCPARLVVFFVDACRDDPARPRPASELGGDWPFPANGQFVLVMGCGPGQVCQYDETGSAFTRSLAGVLDARSPERTLAGVMESVTNDMRRRSRQAQGVAQVPALRNRDSLMLASDVVVCDGDELTDAWRKAIGASPLLELCDDQDQIRDLVADCARRCGAATQMLADRAGGLADPWTQPDYPARVLKNTELLLRRAGFLDGASQRTEANDAYQEETPALHPGEAALLIAAPFLREAVLAAGIKEAAAINPVGFDRTYTPGARSDLELTHEMYPHLVRRAVGLSQSADAKASDQIALWLVHRWLADRTRLWDEAAAIEARTRGGTLIAGCQGNASAGEAPKLVESLLLAVGADPADERLLARLTRPYVSDRWRFLAVILWLAGTMAADPRRLPPVVADLVGTRMELPLTEVQYAAGLRAKWLPAADGVLDLHLVCEHPALHDAFEDIVHRASATAQVSRSRLSLPRDLADTLPRAFADAGLRPATNQDDRAAYELPLSRFQIAEEKVRELLMGRQLYGDPSLAIRELYQNALDACRWRATRQVYLERENKSPAPWAGRIQISQGTEDGRSFIDCEDNGVGMDIDTLKHVFANAGERFVYGREFRAEQAAWADLDPPLRMISNSQFGVGVFSYFMLADEITVTTRHQRSNGVVEDQAHEVRIASSGSLFQIKPATGMLRGGTRVRLYLSGEMSKISVLATLRDLLWVAEHQVKVREGTDKETWEPGVLRYPQGSESPLKCGADVWWVPGMGGLIADGLKTGNDIYGLVVNLHDEHRPQFTVDRKTLRSWDEAWVDGRVAATLPALMDWSGFALSWLWEMVSTSLGLAQTIFNYATANSRDIAIKHSVFRRELVPLRDAGFMPTDRALLDRRSNSAIDGNISAWRIMVWKFLGYGEIISDRFSSRSHDLIPLRVDGFPIPDVIDGQMINLWDDQSRDYLTSELFFDICAMVGCSPLSGARRLQKYAITGADISAARRVPLADCLVRPDDGKLISLLASRLHSPEGVVPQRASLVRALVSVARELDQPPAIIHQRAQGLGLKEWFSSGPDAAILIADAQAVIQAFGDSSIEYLEEVRPPFVVRLMKDGGKSLEEVLELCDLLAKMDITIPCRDAYPVEANELELRALEYVAEPGERLDFSGLVKIAGELKISLGAVWRDLARLEVDGLLLRPGLAGFDEHIPTARDLELLSGKFRGSLESSRIDRLPLWLQIVGIIAHPRGQSSPWLASARWLAPFVRKGRPFDGADLIETAYRLDMTPADAARVLRRIFPGLEVPEPAAECADLAVPSEVHQLLSTTRSGIGWLSTPLTLAQSADSAGYLIGDFVGLIDPFRALSEGLPPFSEPVREMLNEFQPDAYDLDLLSLSLRSDSDEAPSDVASLALVQAAGRFGMTLAEVHQRLSRLEALGLVLRYPRADIPDESVYWYDLLVLTGHFDGRTPAISGRIDWPYLRNAAVEIFDCPAEEAPEKAVFLRDRLRLYASLFQLELPEGTSPTLA